MFASVESSYADQHVNLGMQTRLCKYQLPCIMVHEQVVWPSLYTDSKMVEVTSKSKVKQMANCT